MEDFEKAGFRDEMKRSSARRMSRGSPVSTWLETRGKYKDVRGEAG
jgi:hypothetical protein